MTQTEKPDDLQLVAIQSGFLRMHDNRFMMEIRKKSVFISV